MTYLLLVLETLLAPIGVLFVVISFLLSPRRGRLEGLSRELPERLGIVPAEVRERLASREVWWLHAASAGEVGGLIPLIEALARRPHAPAIVLTTTTRSGRDAARALPGVAWAQLAPLDAWPCVARFIKLTAPHRLILAETELWPTTLILAARAGLSPALVNARMTTGSFSRYRVLAPFLAPALNALAVVGAQTNEDRDRYVALGVPAARTRVTGSMKYDLTAVPAADAAAAALVATLAWTGAPLFVAGSTHPFEEEMVLAAFLAARRACPALKLVLAPRHLERAADAADLLAHAGLKVSRWSAPPAANSEALLLDRMGALPSFYALSRVAFVGGTLVKVGGHNLLEPALAGVPVLFGPHVGHIEHPAALLAAHGGGGRRLADVDELAAQVTAFAMDEVAARAVGAAARATAESLRGATDRTLAALERA